MQVFHIGFLYLNVYRQVKCSGELRNKQGLCMLLLLGLVSVFRWELVSLFLLVLVIVLVFLWFSILSLYFSNYPPFPLSFQKICFSI